MGVSPTADGPGGGSRSAAEITVACIRIASSLASGNFSVGWFLSTAYTVIFLFRLGFPRVLVDTLTMKVHIPFATLFVLCCAWNMYHTPNQGRLYRRLHIIVGWVAMVTGACHVLSGVAYFLQGSSKLPLSMATLMCTIAMMQLCLQALGLYYIRVNTWVHMHMSMMTYMYYTSGVLIAMGPQDAVRRAARRLDPDRLDVLCDDLRSGARAQGDRARQADDGPAQRRAPAAMPARVGRRAVVAARVSARSDGPERRPRDDSALDGVVRQSVAAAAPRSAASPMMTTITMTTTPGMTRMYRRHSAGRATPPRGA